MGEIGCLASALRIARAELGIGQAGKGRQRPRQDEGPGRIEPGQPGDLTDQGVNPRPERDANPIQAKAGKSDNAIELGHPKRISLHALQRNLVRCRGCGYQSARRSKSGRLSSAGRAPDL